MRKIPLSRFQKLLQDNGTYEKFQDKLKEISMMFPKDCIGSVRYPFLYDMVYIEIVVQLEIQVIFKGADRASKILEIIQINKDEYINMICTPENQEFQQTYKQMMEYINKGKERTEGNEREGGQAI